MTITNNPEQEENKIVYEQPTLKKQLEEDITNIKLTDSDETLELFHYIKCDNSSSDLIKNSRGLIFDGDKLIVRTFPFTRELSPTDDRKEIEDSIPNLSQFDIFESIEGTLIRMFYHNNKWYTATHRKLNAFKTKWSKKESFGTLFVQALIQEVKTNETLKDKISTKLDDIFSSFQSILDIDKQYLFVIKNTDDNCIVCSNDEHKLYHVGTIIDNKLTFDINLYDIEYPKKLNFSTIDEMINYVNTINYNVIPGIILFSKDDKHTHYKIINDEYKYLYQLRGNESSIKFRYLNIRMDEEKRELFTQLYKYKKDIFDNYENILYDKAKEIYTSYVNRYIKKQYVTLPKEEYDIMRKAHEWYQTDRDNNKISIDKVISILNSQTPVKLNRIIKQVIISKKNLESNKEHVKLI